MSSLGGASLEANVRSYNGGLLCHFGLVGFSRVSRVSSVRVRVSVIRDRVRF